MVPLKAMCSKRWATPFTVSVSSFVPDIASGTIDCTSCAKNPSTIVPKLDFHSNLYGFKCFSLNLKYYIIIIT